MSWEQRMREMILAGGALTAAACGGPTSAQANKSATIGPNEESPSRDDGSSNDPAGDIGLNSDAAVSPLECCGNANTDPCCLMGCSPATAASYNDCEESQAQCEAMNGSYRQPDGSLGCTLNAVSAGCGQSLAAFCDEAATAHEAGMGMRCDSMLSQAQANLVQSACMPVEGFSPQLTRGCNGYDVLLVGAIEYGTGEYFDPTTGNLVAIVTFGQIPPYAQCIAGPADFVVPQCSAATWIDLCADTDAGHANAGDAAGSNAVTDAARDAAADASANDGADAAAE